MGVIQMTPTELGARLRSDAKGAPKAVFMAMFSSAQRGKAFLVKKTPVDRGILRNAWKVIKLSQQMTVELTNDQPYAGIMERGSKPFKMSSEGLWALKGWVARKIKEGKIVPEGTHTKISYSKGWNRALRIAKGQGLVSRKKLVRPKTIDESAEQIAYAIARSFERVGMKGRYYVLSNINELAKLMDAEVNRSLSSFFNRVKQGGDK